MPRCREETCTAKRCFVFLKASNSLEVGQPCLVQLLLYSDWCWKYCSSEKDKRQRFPCNHKLHTDRCSGGKSAKGNTGADLLCDRREVHFISRGGKISELPFIISAQEGEGGQGDVRLIKVFLDLICILCENDRDWHTVSQKWSGDEKFHYMHMFDACKDVWMSGLSLLTHLAGLAGLRYHTNGVSPTRFYYPDSLCNKKKKIYI